MGKWSDAYQRKWPVIIAMQGDPYSLKTAIANELVEWINCPVIRLEEVLEALYPSSKPPPTLENAEKLVSQAFDIITQIVRTHTCKGFSVIIDSPLSRRSHLDKLLEILVDSREKNHNIAVSFLIIECTQKVKYIGQMRFEKRHPNTFNKWYKPQKWPLEPEFTGRDYIDDDVHPLVSKLVIDPGGGFRIVDLVAAVHDLTAGPEGHKVELNDWKPIHHPNPHVNTSYSLDQNKEYPLSLRHRHYITIFKQEGIDYDASCGVCNNSLSLGEAYACELCRLAIHKSCAEIKACFTPKTFPKFYDKEPEPSFCYPKEHLCSYCKEDEDDEFSYECPSCILECHLKCRLFPTVVHHPGHNDWLFFTAMPISQRFFKNATCHACYLPMENAGYQCNECAHCTVIYHPECVLLPPFVRHEHGGYTHDLELICCRDKELEDYICHLCFETLNPLCWYYYCKHCFLEFHLACAFQEFE